MGRAIETENRMDAIEVRLKLVEDALAELVQTRVHHVDLHEIPDVSNVIAEGVEGDSGDSKYETSNPPLPTHRKKSKRKKVVSA